MKNKRNLLYLLLSLFAFGCFGCMDGQIVKLDDCALGHKKNAAGHCQLDRGCEEDEKCIQDGKCTRAQGMCIATSQRDCIRSRNCTSLGQCFYKDDRQGKFGRCVASEQGCQQSDVCRQYGKCHSCHKGFCVVESDADCQQSDLCANDGRCTASGSASSVKSCQR